MSDILKELNELVVAERSEIVAIADAVRSKIGTVAEMSLDEIVRNIMSISSGIDTSDATAIAEDILSGKTAYVNGEKVTGAFTIDEEIALQDDLIEQLSLILDSKAGSNTGASIDTCTVEYVSNVGDVQFGFTIFEDSMIKTEYVVADTESKQIQNVVCGSVAALETMWDVIEDSILSVNNNDIIRVYYDSFYFDVPNTETVSLSLDWEV